VQLLTGGVGSYCGSRTEGFEHVLEDSRLFFQKLFADFTSILTKMALCLQRTGVLLLVRCLGMLTRFVSPPVVSGWPFMQDGATARTASAILDLVLSSSQHQSWNWGP